jgi:hypothetical protein
MIFYKMVTLKTPIDTKLVLTEEFKEYDDLLKKYNKINSLCRIYNYIYIKI